jgi:hypothetical protein
MSFAVSCPKTGLEYNGTSLNALFAQRENLLKPSFWGMLQRHLRFNREAPKLLQHVEEMSLGDYSSSRAAMASASATTTLCRWARRSGPPIPPNVGLSGAFLHSFLHQSRLAVGQPIGRNGAPSRAARALCRTPERAVPRAGAPAIRRCEK